MKLNKYLIILLSSYKLLFADDIDIIDEQYFVNNTMLLNNYQVEEYDDVWQRMIDGFQLQYYNSPRVKYYEKFYTKNPAKLTQTFNQASIYIYFILTQLERYGLPSELALIPIVESDYNAEVINGTGRYDGIWQINLITSQRFNLPENASINERKNVIKSTNAAIDYFIYLHNVFLQWDTTIGAYNWGPGNMYKAIINSKQQLGKVNYETLPLRKITADYVPKLIALSHIIKNPDRFGIELKNVTNKPSFRVTKPIMIDNIQNIMTNAKISPPEFKKLNPQFKNDTANIGTNDIIVLPNLNYNLYIASIDKYYNKNKVQDEDMQILLASIDENNSLAMNDAINTSNNMTPTSIVKDEDTITNIIATNDLESIPTNSNKSDDLIAIRVNKNESRTIKPVFNNSRHNQLIATTTKQKYHTIKKGETLYSISKSYNINLKQIMALNKIRNYDIKLGQKIKLY
jgi:membrane-bound lytic murein transglycosylase D